MALHYKSIYSPLNFGSLHCWSRSLQHLLFGNCNKKKDKNENGFVFSFENTTCRGAKPVILMLQTTSHLSLGGLGQLLYTTITHGLINNKTRVEDFSWLPATAAFIAFPVFYARTNFSFPLSKITCVYQSHYYSILTT